MGVRVHASRSDVVFVTMPFVVRAHPSLGLSLLKAALRKSGIDSRILYLNLEFALQIGKPFYDAVIDTNQTKLVGEWTFSADLFSRSAQDTQRFIDDVLTPMGEDFTRNVLDTRAQVSAFMDRAAAKVLAHNPRLVGFTSTFEQHAASLALARRLKAARPDLTIIFGGGNCEGAMGGELIRQFPFVDAVVSGEGDLIVTQLAGNALAGKSIDDLQGVYTQANIADITEKGYPTAPSVLEMDTLPYPDFTDYFAQIAALPTDAEFKARLLFETSRGCWWGAKHHCTFCGLNGTTMAFRSKSATRALDELQALIDTYDTRAIGVVDNILDMKYFNDFVPALIKRDLKLDITYEVKANLKKEHLYALRAAGIRTLQPGVESLSTSVLKLMDKGVRGLQNIQLLKWCKELGMFAAWNILWGFPGESEDAYAEVARIVPMISHLNPPMGLGKMRLDRFSPNFDTAEAKGLINVRPCPTYALVYDMPIAALQDFAYYFEFDYAVPRDLAAYTGDLEREVEEWRVNHANSELVSIDFGDSLLVVDFRAKHTRRARVLKGVDRLMYQQCDAITSARQLQQLAEINGEPLTTTDLEDRLEPLLREGLLLRESDAYLALAIPFGDYVPSSELYERLKALTALSKLPKAYA